MPDLIGHPGTPGKAAGAPGRSAACARPAAAHHRPSGSRAGTAPTGRSCRAVPGWVGQPGTHRRCWIPHQVRDDMALQITVMPDLIGHPGTPGKAAGAPGRSAACARPAAAHHRPSGSRAGTAPTGRSCRAVPGWVGQPGTHRRCWIPHQVRDDVALQITVMPDLIGHPDARRRRWAPAQDGDDVAYPAKPRLSLGPRQVAWFRVGWAARSIRQGCPMPLRPPSRISS